MTSVKEKWVLTMLKFAPLDRIRLMKSLFLVWWKSGKNIPDYFEFEPYLYGPYSVEVYRVLEDLEQKGLVIQLPHFVPNWSTYYLTLRGKKAADEVISSISPDLLRDIESTVREVARLSFYELLRRVYEEAPEFAKNSVVREMLKP